MAQIFMTIFLALFSNHSTLQIYFESCKIYDPTHELIEQNENARPAPSSSEMCGLLNVFHGDGVKFMLPIRN